MTDNEIDSNFADIKDQLAEIKSKLNVREETERELLVMYHNVRGFMRVLSWIESISVWIAKMSVAAGILWLLFKEFVREAVKKSGES